MSPSNRVVMFCKKKNPPKLNCTLLKSSDTSPLFCVVLLWEVCEDEGAFLRRQLLLPGLFQQLLPHDGEDRAQQRPPEDLRGLVARQAVAELRHVAVAEPPAGGSRERCGQSKW